MNTSALFIDRPALLLPEIVERGQSTLRLDTNALDGLLDLNPEAYRLFFVGNDDALAFERVAEKRHERACSELRDELAARGLAVTADYSCPYATNAPLSRRRDSVFRLPNVGAMKAARLEYDVRLETSWIVSDRAEAMLAGSRAGVRTALVRSPRNERRFDVTPDLVADDLGTAIRFLNRLQVVMQR